MFGCICEETDFDFCKRGQNESEFKGSVRRKINALPSIMDSSKAKKLDLVLRRKSGESKFTEMLIGDGERLTKHKETFFNLLSDDLLSLISTDEKVEE